MKKSFSTILLALSLVLACCTKEINNIVGPSPAAAPIAALTATPDTLPIGGGKVVLKWTTLNALGASINQGIGAVSVNDSLV